MGKRGTQLHKRLGCIGYYGFGGGYMKGRAPENVQGGLYCNRCPVKGHCWTLHRARVRLLFPDLCAELDAMIGRSISIGGRGQDAVMAFQKKYDSAPPDICANVGNLQDGVNVGEGGAPEDRGPASLSWPLTPIEEILK